MILKPQLEIIILFFIFFVEGLAALYGGYKLAQDRRELSNRLSPILTILGLQSCCASLFIIDREIFIILGIALSGLCILFFIGAFKDFHDIGHFKKGGKK